MANSKFKSFLRAGGSDAEISKPVDLEIGNSELLKEKEEVEYYLEKIEFAKNSEFYKRPIVILKSKRQEG